MVQKINIIHILIFLTLCSSSEGVKKKGKHKRQVKLCSRNINNFNLPNFFQCHDQNGTIFEEGESYTQDCVTYKCTKLGKKMMTMVPSVIGYIYSKNKSETLIDAI